MGHVHESYAMVNMVERLNKNNKVQLKEVLQVRTPTYKRSTQTGTSASMSSEDDPQSQQEGTS